MLRHLGQVLFYSRLVARIIIQALHHENTIGIFMYWSSSRFVRLWNFAGLTRSPLRHPYL